jgi:pimeloyl-ACP methyl ester carboxylesterase
MTTFVLIPGAGGAAWYWHRVLPSLEQAGHEALAIDLPGDDARAGLHAYADLVIASIGKRNNVTLVAQSMGAFTATLVCARARTPIRMLVFVNAMIPLPGETAPAPACIHHEIAHASSTSPCRQARRDRAWRRFPYFMLRRCSHYCSANAHVSSGSILLKKSPQTCCGIRN